VAKLLDILYLVLVWQSHPHLLPKNIKLTPDDVWQKIAYVLSIKILDPQFSGQTKERLSSRECAGFVSNTVKDAFSLWLNNCLIFFISRCFWLRVILRVALPNKHEIKNIKQFCHYEAKS
jgi:hypothetical protein